MERVRRMVSFKSVRRRRASLGEGGAEEGGEKSPRGGGRGGGGGGGGGVSGGVGGFSSSRLGKWRSARRRTPREVAEMEEKRRSLSLHIWR